MLLRMLFVERVVPEYSATGEPVSYRLYTKSARGWKYDYCLIHSTNREEIQYLLERYKVDRLENLRDVPLPGYVEGNKLVRLAGMKTDLRSAN